jgi:hypothetical protein
MSLARIGRYVLMGSLLLGWSAALAWGQQAAPTQPASQPATDTGQRKPITARVLELHGDVKHAALEAEDWQDCRLDDEYGEQTVIQTGLRSSIKLQIGADDTYTAVVIESASRTVLSELNQTADTKHVRIGVGYGRMRAGVAEGGLKSDFVVDSPVATLSKRGTWDFGLFYERATDRFEIFLLDQGLVDAFSKVSGLRREVLPQQVVTQVMRRWLDEAQMRRNVAIPDILGQGDIEVAFNTLAQSGLRVLNPEGGQTVLVDLSTPAARDHFAELVQRSMTMPTAVPRGTLTPKEGFFGTGRGDELIPIVIEATSPMAQKGLAQPGKYTFRRQALDNWMAQRGASPRQ